MGSAQADAQPAGTIERAGDVEGATDDGVKCAADLGGGETGGEVVVESGPGEVLESAAAVGE